MPKGIKRTSGRIAHPREGGLVVRGADNAANGGWVVRSASTGRFVQSKPPKRAKPNSA